MATKTTPKKTKLRSVKKSVNGIVYLNVALDETVYLRIVKFKKAKGLLKDQEVARMAIGFFLLNQGY